MKNKREQGITLIALIVTIIVLLILAGITISTLVGDDGILTKTMSASEKTEISNVIELMKLEGSNYFLKKKDITEGDIKEFIEYLKDKNLVFEDENRKYYIKFKSSNE